MNIDVSTADFERIEKGLIKYQSIMDLLQKTNVAENKDFQKLFNGFYRMRQRSTDYYSAYFNFLENNKLRTDITFDEVITYFFTTLNRIEASFSSKLLATINPDKPVWDKFVLTNIGLKQPSYATKNRLEKTIRVYSELDSWYYRFMNSEQASEIISLFDSCFPLAKITNTKKIDLLLWQSR